MSCKRYFLTGTFLLLGGAIVWAIQPALPPSALSRLTQKQRQAYFQWVETSDLVSYYCQRDTLPSEVADDVENSLLQDHGVGEVGCRVDE